VSRRVRAGRPVLALVAVVATALGVSACGIPTAAAPTPIAKADVPSHLLDPVTPTTVVSTLPPAVAVPETIFLVAPDQHVIAVSRDVQIPANLSDTLGALLEGPSAAESRFGLQSFLTGTRTGVTATVAGGVATVDFTSNPVQVVGPDQTLAVAQVVYTATQQPGVTGVVFEIAGKPIGVPTAGGAQVSAPVGRSSYLPQAPLP
jgi:spore germination protein GerM